MRKLQVMGRVRRPGLEAEGKRLREDRVGVESEMGMVKREHRK